MLTTPEVKKILYVTDLGKHTRPVFLHALAQAANNNASLHVLHVVEPMTEVTCAVIQQYLSEEDVKKVRKDGMKKVLKYMKKRIDKFLHDECGGKSLESEPIEEILVVAGKPSEEILRVAEEHEMDMIVIGKSSRKVRGSKVMGSTTRRVNRLSKIPVLVVPNVVPSK
ncbi:universal stress protein [Desulfosediminicola flagellatus]|uniref:universal stress protein n=1 Tax=Desulfosediminicola flagellatus TaxID=2569541 RepID=UPI0010ACF740|nr:universal stress protein [Desulfosediminicola flagellatus]